MFEIVPDKFACARRRVAAGLLLILSSVTTITPAAQERKLLSGVDVSMLPEIEKAGGVYRAGGRPGDAVRIFRDHGCDLFRLRLFVDPNKDFTGTDGATQDLAAVKALAQRIKAAGGTFLLNLHYSDTWADPEHQHKPRAWADLEFDALEQKVFDYTASVLEELRANGTPPEMVQVGNEITSGILWPDGKVLDVPKDRVDAQWAKFRRLIRAGARAVRASATDSYKPSIVLHIHGGGKRDLPQWFFGKFSPKTDPVDFDVIALSFYPAWGDSLVTLATNMNILARDGDKGIVVAETSYPWREMEGIKDKSAMVWPMTKEGQSKFVDDLSATVRAVPNARGLGSIWWYPEAVPVREPAYRIWRRGAEALFDADGNPLPALGNFGSTARSRSQ